MWEWLTGRRKAAINRGKLFLSNLYAREDTKEPGSIKQSRIGITGYLCFLGKAVGSVLTVTGVAMLAAPFVLGATWLETIIAMGATFLLAKQFFHLDELFLEVEAFYIVCRTVMRKQDLRDLWKFGKAVS